MECQGKYPGKWATRHDCCRGCGSTERPHRARGFCRQCYQVDYEARIRNPPGSGRIGRGRPSLRSQIPKPSRKSLTIEFPEMPAEMVRHFIRGCWDGDGCICKDGDRASSWRAIYCSGSQMFVASLHNALVHLGMQLARIHRDRRATVYTVRWSGWKCGILFRILYDSVPDQQYLLRKYTRFRMAERETSEAPRRASRHRR